MGIRTDLAIEASQLYAAKNTSAGIDGVESEERETDGIKTTIIKITNEHGEQALGKPKGSYITIESPDIQYSVDIYEKTCIMMSGEIKKLANLTDKTKTLVVGLGNKKITPDALGPDVVSQLMITNHIKEHMKEFFDDDLTSVSAIAPGVLGTTGMETSEIIKGVINQTHPDLVIAVDALASRSLDRISTTFQLCDTGINPGSGVSNSRQGLNEETLGVKVIAIGVPTVVDAFTIASDSIDMVMEDISSEFADEEKKNDLIKKSLTENIGMLMVTPKNIDSIIEKTSKTVANAINLALHKNLTFEKIESFVE